MPHGGHRLRNVRHGRRHRLRVVRPALATRWQQRDGLLRAVVAPDRLLSLHDDVRWPVRRRVRPVPDVLDVRSVFAVLAMRLVQERGSERWQLLRQRRVQPGAVRVERRRVAARPVRAAYARAHARAVAGAHAAHAATRDAATNQRTIACTDAAADALAHGVAHAAAAHRGANASADRGAHRAACRAHAAGRRRRGGHCGHLRLRHGGGVYRHRRLLRVARPAARGGAECAA
mmetsp:Transcript_55627/g.136519  ORF Transcript_55627/g.136519 Transcript_55627/m.136519 type:complete len:232 (+) Transcript_55627:630-1325(+)